MSRKGEESVSHTERPLRVECGIDWRRENGGWGLGRRLGQGSRGSVVMERRDDMERSWGQEGGTWGLRGEASEEVGMAVEGPVQ